jgi:hypothetical protein
LSCTEVEGVDLTSKRVFASESLQLLTSRESVPQSNPLPSADDLALQEPGITQTNILSFLEGKPTIGGYDLLIPCYSRIKADNFSRIYDLFPTVTLYVNPISSGEAPRIIGDCLVNLFMISC